ncbi:HAAS signaling domain-containing protein [Ornithinicoccus hortensis]|uniref:Putative membrane protein n=1 Tax=Ornithinicoccus hortensis TaxID=82346 RepID=A0A542YND2_9MICO|nr:hypothetical protein [Ornithinicoccus hortensis]TQL49539.1 putative membrane protein [Ornithinicoccus hortensis]
MNNTHSRLIEGYLEDLARRLASLPPEDRMEVLDGVREHIDTALADRPGPSEEEVRAVLAEVGPSEEVAREAYAGRPAVVGVAGPMSAPYPDRPPLASRDWVPVFVAVVQVVSVFASAVVIGGSSAWVVTSTDSSGASTSSFGGSIVAATAAAALVAPLWIALVLFVGNSRLWNGREKLAHILLLPVVLALMGLLPELGNALVGVNGVYAGSWAALALVVLGGGWLVVRLTRAGLGRVRR